MALHLSLRMHLTARTHYIRGPDHAPTRYTAPKLHPLSPVPAHPDTGQRKYDHPTNPRTMATPKDT
eukprot:11705185-Prorocentrum_lima.AAC.1